MRQFIKGFSLLILVVLATPLVAFLVYDVAYFEPNRSAITQVIESADPEERSLPSPIADFVRLEFHDGTVGYSARLLISRLGIVQYPVRASHWASTYALWSALVWLHLDSSERVTIIAALAPTGTDRHGLASTSQALFGKSLSELTPQQCATLMALVKIPALERYPEKLTRVSDSILAKYHGT